MKRFSFFYWVVGGMVRFALSVFYSRKTVIGARDLPLDHQVIFSPNHQNAFMDALVIAIPVYARKQLGFMVRQDVFNNKIAAYWLNALKLFPAYRMRDGYENLSKNNETFEYCYKLMESGNGVIIFPEANHAVVRKLRPLKKGLMRIAFGAQERNKGPVKIVPVGINYSEPQNFGGELLLIFGEPIDVSDYQQTFKDNPAKANLKLKERVEEAMRPLIIDIRENTLYDALEIVIQIASNHYLGRKAPLYEKFKFQKALIDKLEGGLEQSDFDLKENIETYNKSIDRNGLRDWVYDVKKVQVSKILIMGISLLLSAPVFVLGTLLNYVPFNVPAILANKYIKDDGFKSSIKIAGAIVLFPLWYTILTIIMLFICPVWWQGFFIGPVAAAAGLISLVWLRAFNRLSALMKYRKLLRSEDKDLKTVNDCRQALFAFIDGLD